MLFQITGEELRKALKAIEAAEANGFMHCEAVLHFGGTDHHGNVYLSYSDLIEKAHPTNGHFNWGRYQGVTRRNKFIDGRLVPIEPK